MVNHAFIRNCLFMFSILMIFQIVTATPQASCYGNIYPQTTSESTLDTTQTAIDVCSIISGMGYNAVPYTTSDTNKLNNAWVRLKTDNIFYAYGHGLTSAFLLNSA